MAASSSNTSQIPSSTLHDIFLSHSGAQKGFVADLYNELHYLSFNTFFDVAHHSLPLAESFPKHIFSVAKGCKLAVVVLSEEFVSSKWPMLELSAFVEAHIQILPLFFKLTPADLKNDTNLKRWKKAWEVFSAQDTRIKLTEWGDAIKALCSQNGITFNGSAVEGEATYLHRVVSGICEIVPRASNFDGPNIHGMNQLRQAILDNFKQMESLQNCFQEKVCVLGLYGLPGSGKSTLCKCLCDHFFPIYGGRSLHLELPTKPSTADLVHQFKKLLRLTDFKDRFNIGEILELEQVFNLLASYQLRRCRAFLVIDNISDDSWDALRMFLPLGLGPGSRVILVARTLDILQPAFHLLDDLDLYKQLYKWDNMQIPSIQEKEAVQILLQTSGHELQHANYLTPTQREIVEGIVRMCNFGSEHSPLYLPLFMKTMGAMLIKYDGGFSQWVRDMRNFWGRVKTYKEKALIELVKDSFKALPDEELQLLFLDLSLFILPLNSYPYPSLEDVYDLLRIICDGRSVADIEVMIKDLQRHCFLTIHDKLNTIKHTISVHDVYLEFAKSISEDPSRVSSSIRYYWRIEKCTAAKDDKVMSLKEEQGIGVEHQKVRTMILEVQGDGCERVELQGFSSLKALVVRECKSLQVLGLVGLSSLASLEILKCPNFRYVDAGASDLCKVRRLIISSPQGGKAGDKGSRGQRGSRVGEAWARIFKWPQTPQRCSLEMGFATKMRGLQQLTVENTGIRRLIMAMPGNCWPQLQNLTVKERYLEAFQVGNLPNLKRFHFSDTSGFPTCIGRDIHIRGAMMNIREADKYRITLGWDSKKDNIPRFMLQGKGLLEGCPQLEQVEIQSAFFEKGELGTLPPNMVSFRLDSFYPARMLPDLSPSAHTLKEVLLQWCEKLEKISFLVEFGNLTRVEVAQCHSLVELTGLGFLFSLRFFFVSHCSNLRTILGPFHNLKMLEYFHVGDKCPKLTGLAGADFENLVSLRSLQFPLKRADRNRRFKLENLQKLEWLTVRWRENIKEDDESDCSTSTMQQLGGMLDGLGGLVNLRELVLDGKHILHEPSSTHKQEQERTKPALSLSFSSLVGLDEHQYGQTLTFSNCGNIYQHMKLKNLRDLASMDGLDQLNYLKHLDLHCLENLTSLQGLGSLVHLGMLSLKYCPMLEELPSLHTLVDLRRVFIHHCSKLKCVEGADVILRPASLEPVIASFEGCNSLLHLPFSVAALAEYEDRISYKDFNILCHIIRFKDCKFAGIEAMMAWVVNEDMPASIRMASFCQLYDKYCIGDSSLREVLFDGFFPFLLNIFIPNDNECLNFDSLTPKIMLALCSWEERVFVLFPEVRELQEKVGLFSEMRELQEKVGGVVRELQETVGGIAKKDLVQKFQAHPQCKLLMLRLLAELGLRHRLVQCFKRSLPAFQKAKMMAKANNNDEANESERAALIQGKMFLEGLMKNLKAKDDGKQGWRHKGQRR